MAVPRTCPDVLKQGGGSGWYMLDPDQDGQDEFPVFCNMTSDPITATLHHNQETGNKVKGYEAPESYVAEVLVWSTILFEHIYVYLYIYIYMKQAMQPFPTMIMLNGVISFLVEE